MTPPRKLAILAGRGALPRALAEHCQQAGIPYLIVAFPGQTETALTDKHPHLWRRLGAIGGTLHALRQAEVSHIVMAGGMHKPPLHSLFPDQRGFKILMTLGFRYHGDNRLLQTLIAEIEADGFTVIGADALLPNLLTPAGTLTRLEPPSSCLADMAKGFAAAKALGAYDVGQAVIIQNGLILSLEGVEGTTALLARSKAYIDTTLKAPALLIKACKPQQEKRADLPTIGTQTIAECLAAGIKGIALEAGASQILEQQQTLAAANAAGIFIVGYQPA